MLRTAGPTEGSLASAPHRASVSPNSAKRKQRWAEGECSKSAHGKIETQEKKPRSMLDCLDQTYFGTKRESEEEISQAAEEASEERAVDSEVVIDIEEEEMSVDDCEQSMSREANLMSEMSQLEKLQMSSDGGNETEASPESIPGTPPASEPFASYKTLNQRKILDFLKKS